MIKLLMYQINENTKFLSGIGRLMELGNSHITSNQTVKSVYVKSNLCLKCVLCKEYWYYFKEIFISVFFPRDLGSSLHNVTVLWMARCGLEDLDGLSSLNNLRELYLCYNEIYDISPCSMLEHIKILDLEG